MTENTERELMSIFNLKQYEARIYRAVLSYGAATPSDIARKTKIPRTALYAPIRVLLEKAFLTQIKIGKRLRYNAISGDDLLKLFKQKTIALESLIPELANTSSLAQKGFAATFYQGADGIMLASNIFLEETKSGLWKIFENPLHTLAHIGIPQYEHFLKIRINRGIRARVVTPSSISQSSWIREKISVNKKELREVVMVSSQTYPLDATIAVNENLVLVIVAKDDIFALLLRSKALCGTIGSIHDLVWHRFQT